MIVSPAFSGQRFAVLGLARSGAAVAEALLASGAELLVWDRRENLREPFADRCRVGDPLLHDLSGFAGVVLSPGVPLNSHPIRAHAERFAVPLLGDIELFARARPDLPAHLVAGITGTNGKSTTTALLHHILVESGFVAAMAGNIGLPIMARRPLRPNARGPAVYVLELSSFQIDLTASLACDVAALTNISPDHLDRYNDLDHYARAKARLFEMQQQGQWAIFGCGDDRARAIRLEVASTRGETEAVCADVDALAPLQREWPGLQGPHNLQNAAIAVGMARRIGASQEECLRALSSFRALPHRMEQIGRFGGVLFVNDSKATNPASAAPALAAFPPAMEGAGARPRVHWIVGGLPKEEGLGECADLIGHVACAYTIGEAGPQFAALIEPHAPVERCEMLCEAVRRAIANAQPGDVVLLAPACASFDQFRDYEQRGDAFREIVSVLAGGEMPEASSIAAACLTPGGKGENR